MRSSGAHRNVIDFTVMLMCWSVSFGSEIIHFGNISSDETWFRKDEHMMVDKVIVQPGATLTIEPGTIVYSKRIDPENAVGCGGAALFAPALVILQGGKIIANGTADEMITFTSENDLTSEPESGTWGGVIVLGRAPINKHKVDGTMNFVEGIEGGLYGGDDEEDNSGILRFVRIWYGGAQVNQDNEINGLTLAGVGRQTVVEHIEVAYNLDDGVEIFGGRVNVRFLSLLYNEDDSLDIDQGYQGTIQYVFILLSDKCDNAYEFDSYSSSSPDQQPRSHPVISHATLIGPGEEKCDVFPTRKHKRLTRMREGLGGTFVNHIFLHSPSAGKVEEGHPEIVNSWPNTTNALYFSNSWPETTDTSNLAFKVESGGDIHPGILQRERVCLRSPCEVLKKGQSFYPGINEGPALPFTDTRQIDPNVGKGTLDNAPYPGAFEPGAVPWLAGFSLLDKMGYLSTTPCPLGEVCDYGEGKSGLTCYPCPGGELSVYNDALMNRECVECQAGKFCQLATVAAAVCDSGYYCPPGSERQEPCPTGTWSGNSTTSFEGCKPCDAGRFGGTKGQSACGTCGLGEYSGASGSTTCDVCDLGKYQSKEGQTECISCPYGTTKVIRASDPSAECKCGDGTYEAANGTCRQCPEGMTCKFGSNAANFASRRADQQDAVNKKPLIPELKEGYYSKWDAPLSVYKCPGSGSGCAGGEPESCAGGRINLVCATCPEGEAIDDNACGTCTEGLTSLGVLMPFFLVAGIVFVYYATKSPVTVNASLMRAASILAGVLVTVFQVLSMFRSLSVTWPAEIDSLYLGFSFFLASPSSISYECVLSHDAVKLYATRCCIPLIMIVAVFLLYALSHIVGAFFPKRNFAWKIDQTINCTGQILQAVFIAIAAIVTVPLQCYQHPNLKSSCVTFPQVLCWEGGEHTTLLMFSIVVAIIFVIPYAAVCLYGTRMVVRPDAVPIDQRATPQKRQMVRFRFLLYRFRPDQWYWANIFNFRQLLLAFATSMPAHEPHSQTIYVSTVLLVYVTLQCFFWPWISPEFNVMDAFVTSCLLLITVLSTVYLETPIYTDGYTWFLIFILISLGAFICSFLGLMMWHGLRKGFWHGLVLGKAHFGADKVNKKDAEQVAKDWFETIGICAEAVGQERGTQAVKAMNYYDRWALVNAIAVWESADPGHFGHLAKVNRLAGVPSTTSSFASESLELKRQNSKDSKESSRKSNETETSSEKTSAKLNETDKNKDILQMECDALKLQLEDAMGREKQLKEMVGQMKAAMEDSASEPLWVTAPRQPRLTRPTG